jgi:hypothetical protein
MKQFIQNTSNSPMYASGTMIPPGEGMLVEVPGNEDVAAIVLVPTLADDIAELLKKSVAHLVPELPALSGDALDMMVALENSAEKPRVTLLTAIATEQMARADAAMLAEKERVRMADLEAAQAALLAAEKALDDEGDTHKHPDLSAAVEAAKATVEALSQPAQE